ncbi:MAG: hypothetical protein DSZ08_02635 [Sulfurovum sp.]|nr:MAG: hypothetical protein DSZ08_02635 [Sulfurovum sp.]
MKKSTLLLFLPFLLLLSGCGSMKGLVIYDIDPTLKVITQVRALPASNAVGFEWKKLESNRVHGINIYRGNPHTGKQSLKRIGAVGNRYATHFVDTKVTPDTDYIYTFTTFFLGKESPHGAVLHVKTPPRLEGVTFAKAYAVAPKVVKLLWRPHTNPSINRYIIERSINGGKWKHITQIKGQLSAEYIDSFVKRGYTYSYRILAKSYDGILTKPSAVTSISL